MDKKQIDEGSLVASIQDILAVITKELASEMDKKYKRNTRDGLGFINQVAKSVGMKVTDKKQQDGKLFLKLDNDLEERKQEQDPSVDDEPGTQPKKYYKGLSKKDKEARANHFKKGSKSPAPGDKDAKTTPSKHTQKFKKMYGEYGEHDGETIDDRVKAHKRLQTKHAKDGNKILSKMYANKVKRDLGEGAADKSLNDKSKKSGIPVGILKQVFKRGVKAWQTGHRPGTTAVQWGHARVNSFITKGKGTWGKADKDLADKVRGESNEGLWDNIRKKKERIKKGSGEKMGNKNSVDIDAYNKAKNSK